MLSSSAADILKSLYPFKKLVSLTTHSPHLTPVQRCYLRIFRGSPVFSTNESNDFYIYFDTKPDDKDAFPFAVLEPKE